MAYEGSPRARILSQRRRRLASLSDEELEERNKKKRERLATLKTRPGKAEANKRFRQRKKDEKWDDIVKDLLKVNPKVITFAPVFKASMIVKMGIKDLVLTGNKQ